MSGLQILLAATLLLTVLVEAITETDEHPLIVTSYLREGKIKEAQAKARVVPDIQGVRSFSGYFRVNENCGSNLFFWFYPAHMDWDTAPVLLWLNGGPGSTSLIGMFTEIGPFNIKKKEAFIKREHHWTKDNNVVFIDQPVGTGYSFSDKGCLADNMTMVVDDVYTALVQFFTLFPNLQKNKFFLTGESFGGHYLPAIAYGIHKKNSNAVLKINLLGLVMGPYIDERCIQSGRFLYETGVIDDKTRNNIRKHEQNITNLINNKKYRSAEDAKSSMYRVIETLGIPNSYYNILYDNDNVFDFQFYVRDYKMRKLIHVGTSPCIPVNYDVRDRLLDDMYRPASSYLEALLRTNKYIVGLYSGQLDMVVPSTSQECVLRGLKWPGSPDYLASNRTQWYVNGRLAGWFKVAGNLFEVVVRNSGHYVPTDQPRAALELITAAISDVPGSKLLSKLQTKPPSTTYQAK